MMSLEDGWEPIPPGGEATYHVTAGPFGLHPYHCDATPAAEHLSRGLYGLLVVDPPGGRRPAHEVALVLSGFDVNGDGHNELYGWNGVAGFYERYPIKVPAGELVRVYLLNMVADDPVASFHLHAETFDVYRSGTRLVADERTDVVSLAQTERAIVEFTPAPPRPLHVPSPPAADGRAWRHGMVRGGLSRRYRTARHAEARSPIHTG